jgi:hypothetical protein
MVRDVDWPQAEATGEVFDLDWYDTGTAKAITAAEQSIIDRAFKAPDPGTILYAPTVPAYVRTEYHRQFFVRRFGTQFLHQPPPILAAGDVRGIFYLEWSDFIDHMKRTNHLEEALALTYECIDAAERIERIDHMAPGPGWYDKAAIILRKMNDYEAEVRLIEDVVRRYPNFSHLEQRLPAARKLLAKQHP